MIPYREALDVLVALSTRVASGSLEPGTEYTRADLLRLMTARADIGKADIRSLRPPNADAAKIGPVRDLLLWIFKSDDPAAEAVHAVIDAFLRLSFGLSDANDEDRMLAFEFWIKGQLGPSPLVVKRTYAILREWARLLHFWADVILDQLYDYADFELFEGAPAEGTLVQ